MPFRKECSAWERWLLQCGECLSTGILVAAPSVPSPEPPSPDSPQVPLVPCVLTLPESRVSGCKRNFVCWPFKSLQPSFTGKEKPCCFSLLDVIRVPFWLWCCRMGSPAWDLDPTFLRGNPRLLKYPSGTSAAACGSPASPLAPPLHSLPALLWWFLLSVRGYQASLQLVFSSLFRMISPQFSCNSGSVLGGGSCSFHLLLPHLGTSYIHFFLFSSFIYIKCILIYDVKDDSNCISFQIRSH